MTESAAQPVYLVDPASDPVVVQIDGRACFQNSACLRDFITVMLGQGKRRFVLDFSKCAGMDSTFLGVIAGTALELRKASPPGSLVLARVSPRNFELIRSLGLHRIVTVDAGDDPVAALKCDTPLEVRKCSEIESARQVLEAHEHLVAADETNRSKFKDVLTFLRSRLEQKQASG